MFGAVEDSCSTITKSSTVLAKTSTALAKIAGISSGISTRRIAPSRDAPRSAAASSYVRPIDTSRARTMIAGQLMFQTTSPATSAGVPKLMNVSSCVTSRNNATASSSSGITNEKIITKFSPVEVRLRQRSMPIAKPTPIGTVISVVRTESLSVWMTAECSSGLWRTDGPSCRRTTWSRSPATSPVMHPC